MQELAFELQIQNSDPKFGLDLGSGPNSSCRKSLTLNLGVMPVIISNSLATASITLSTVTFRWSIIIFFWEGGEGGIEEPYPESGSLASDHLKQLGHGINHDVHFDIQMISSDLLS